MLCERRNCLTHNFPAKKEREPDNLVFECGLAELICPPIYIS